MCWYNLSDSHYCYYHPNAKAVDTCERCHKLICLPDKRTYIQSSSPGMMNQTNFSSYNTKYLFCPPCYFEVTEQNFKGFKKVQGFQKPMMFVFIIPFLFIAGFFGIFFVTLGHSDVFLFMFLFFGLFLLIAFLVVFVVLKSQGSTQNKVNDEQQRLEEEKRSFYSTLDSGSRPFGDYNIKKLVCYQCGSPIDKSDLFCGVCGDSTKDELDAIRY